MSLSVVNCVNEAAEPLERSHAPAFDVALLTAGRDKPYAYGLTTALLAQRIQIDLICGDDLNISELRNERYVRVLNLRHCPASEADLLTKITGVLQYYGRLIRYAWAAKPKVFHILWNNKFETIDRVLLTIYYRLLGKKIVLTAHNINIGTRDASDTWLNRLTLTFQYRFADHIFVHTERMKDELVAGFGMPAEAISVVRFGINNAVPRTPITSAEAKKRLGIGAREKTILFFGNIAPYKGLEYLVAAFRQVAVREGEYRLIIAGRPKKGFETYWDAITATIGNQPVKDGIILKIEFVPDEDTEVYFKAADVLALPYTTVFQSGVLFLGYSFGLPVLAADVGSLKDDIVEGQTGFVFAPRDSADLARAINTYFSSDLFKDLEARRSFIEEYANTQHSWEAIADTTRQVYAKVLSLRQSSSPVSA